MKKITTLLFLAMTVLTQAQNIQDQKVTFKYTQLPLVNINDGSLSYQVEVQQAFLQKNEDSLRNYEMRKQAYASQVEAALQIWEQEKLRADKMHLANMMVWEKQIAAGQVGAQKPIQPPYAAPVLPQRPVKPFIVQEVNANSISASVKIDGFTMNAASGTKIILVFDGFEKGQIKETVKGNPPAQKYSYQVQYRHPVTLKIEVAGKGLVVNERIPGTDQFRTHSTKEFDTRAEYQMWWMENEELFWNERQSQIIYDLTTQINNYLNEQYGFPVKNYTAEINTVKSKDYDYSDYLKAYQEASAALQMVNFPNKTADTQAKLRSAIAIWNEALKESDITNRKARIDRQVTAATYVNLCEAYIWLMDYDNAEMAANQALTVSVNKYDRDARRQLAFIQEQRKRLMSQQ